MFQAAIQADTIKCPQAIKQDTKISEPNTRV